MCSAKRGTNHRKKDGIQEAGDLMQEREERVFLKDSKVNILGQKLFSSPRVLTFPRSESSRKMIKTLLPDAVDYIGNALCKVRLLKRVYNDWCTEIQQKKK